MPIGSETRRQELAGLWLPHDASVSAIFVAVLLPALGVTLLLTAFLVNSAEAKTPGQTYCFLGRCHRVLTLAETRRREGWTETLRASFYDHCARDRFNPCRLTSSGEVFRPNAPDNAASPIYPDGTLLLLFYPVTGAASVVRVNNAGPYHTKRLIDVSRATAKAMGFSRKGLADLDVRVLEAPRNEESTYRRNRRYWPVHGPIGRHASIGAAHDALRKVATNAELFAAAPTEDRTALVTAPIGVPVPAATITPATEPARTVAVVAPTSETARPFEPLATDDNPIATVPKSASVDATSAPLGPVQPVHPIRVAASESPSTREAFGTNTQQNLLPPAAQRFAPEGERPAPMPWVEGVVEQFPLGRFLPAIARTPAVEVEATGATAEGFRGVHSAAARTAAATGPPENGLFGALRASARRGVKPVRLPEVSADDGFGSVASLLEGLYALAARARFAARAGVSMDAKAADNGRSGRPLSPR